MTRLYGRDAEPTALPKMPWRVSLRVTSRPIRKFEFRVTVVRALAAGEWRRDEAAGLSTHLAAIHSPDEAWAGSNPCVFDAAPLYPAEVTSLALMSMVMVHPDVPLNSNGAGLGPRR